MSRSSLKNDWQDVQLGDVIEIFDHKRIPLSGQQRKQRQGVYPYYGASGVIDHMDDYIFDGRYLLVAEDGENLNSRKLPIAFFASGKFWVNNHAHVIRGIDGVSDDYFLMSYLQASNISGFITGAAQPKLSQANLKAITLKLPPLQAQQEIVSILSAYDDLIENNTRRIRILEEMAQSLYREWFVHFRFPGHEKVKLVSSPLGKIPEDWAAGTLEEALILQRGFDLPVKQRSPGDVPIYAATGIVGNHNVAKVKGPGVVTGRSGSLGTVKYIESDFWPLNTSLWVKEFRAATPIYAFYLLKNLDLSSFNSGAAVPTLNRNDVHGLQVVLPSKSTLIDFDDYIKPLFGLKKKLKEKNGILRCTRDLLLPKIISGELMVSAA